MTWITYNTGERPLVIVGAGFPLAVLNDAPPSTSNILERTAEDSDKFPIIKCLIDGVLANSPNKDLNYVWTNKVSLGQAVISQYQEIYNAYLKFPSDSCINNLVLYRLRKFPPQNFIITMLGIELKRAIAFYYKNSSIKLDNKSPDLRELLFKKFTQMIWLSLNYDIVLESLIDKEAPNEWEYCFGQFIRPPMKYRAKHVVVKPHGSVNVWFNTVWNSDGNPNTHGFNFVDSCNLLKTCNPDEIGCDLPKGNRCEEHRPWLVGYLPDFMKSEINSPGGFADCAHDLCKLNLTYAALSLYHSTSVYILGYSMPTEDEWLWNRFKALPNKKFPVYIASGIKTDAIVKKFEDIGFRSVDHLSDNDRI
jgi:hypothetical protein